MQQNRVFQLNRPISLFYDAKPDYLTGTQKVEPHYINTAMIRFHIGDNFQIIKETEKSSPLKMNTTIVLLLSLPLQLALSFLGKEIHFLIYLELLTTALLAYLFHLKAKQNKIDILILCFIILSLSLFVSDIIYILK